MIHYPNIPINHHTVRQEYKKFFSYWNWELFITLSFHHRVDFATAIKDTKTWLKDYRHKMRGIKFAGIIQVVHYIGDSPHVHVLLTSDPAYPRTLKDLDSDKSFYPLNLMVSSWELSKKGTVDKQIKYF
jgi:hypothetical protein